MILPGMGIISELISVFSRKHIFGYKFIAYSSVAIALIGFLVWGHHMFVSGQSPLAGMIFSALTFAVAIPSAIKVFNWLATMYKGSIWLATPMCYALSFIFLFGIGGLTGLFLGALSVNVHVHDTYFVVAHFHYVMVGGTVIAFLGGLHYWWPKITGRMYQRGLGPAGGADDLRRLQPDVLPAVHAGHARHAPPLLRLHGAGQEPSRDHHLQRAVVAGGLSAGHRDWRWCSFTCWFRCLPAAGRRPIPGARPRWSGSAARRRRTTIFPRRPRWAIPTISAASSTIPRSKDTGSA